MRRTPALLRRVFWALPVVVSLALLTSAMPASAHHGGAHRLQMVSVTCHTLMDPGNDEEPYLKLNGDRFWQHQDCSPGMRIDLNGLSRDFWADADLELMEDDFGPDDEILWARVGPDANAGLQSRTRYEWTGYTYVAWFTMEWYVTG